MPSEACERGGSLSDVFPVTTPQAATTGKRGFLFGGFMNSDERSYRRGYQHGLQAAINAFDNGATLNQLKDFQDGPIKDWRDGPDIFSFPPEIKIE